MLMMRFELGLEKAYPRRALTSPLTIGRAYAAAMALASPPAAFFAIARAIT
jgi:hypothetical protein